MVRSRPALSLSRATAKKEDLLKLSNEVLQPRLQALNLPIMGSKAQLAARLATALFGNSSKAVACRKKQSSTAKKGTTTRRRSTPNAVHASNLQQSGPNGAKHIHSRPRPRHRGQCPVRQRLVLFYRRVVRPSSPALCHGGDRCGTFSNAFEAFRMPERPKSSPQAVLRSRTPGMASPLGLSRPVHRNLEDRILCGVYVDLVLLLPESLNEPQTPKLQLRLDDLALGPMGYK